jgi:hypothetical protein
MVKCIEYGRVVNPGRPRYVFNSIADNIQGRTICALGDAAAMPVRAFIKNSVKNLNIISSTKHYLVCISKLRQVTIMAEIEIDGKVEVPAGSMVRTPPTNWELTSRTSAITRNCRSQRTAACAWSKWKGARLPACATLRSAGMIVRSASDKAAGAKVGHGILAH